MAGSEGKEQQHVLIIGAGISGLLVAQGLKKHGIPFSIFEAEATAAEKRSREWGMSLQWALPMLRDVLPEALWAKVQTAACDPFYICPKDGTSMPVYNGQTGEKIKDVPLVNFIRVSRNKMRALCATGLDIQYNKSLSSLTTPNPTAITAHFTDSTTATGTLLLAADGAKSTVRSLIFPGDEGHAEQIPYGGVNTHLCYHSAPTALLIRKSFTPIQAIGAHPKGYWLWLSIQDVPSPDDPENWKFQLQWTWDSRAAHAEPLRGLEPEALQAEAAAEFGEPWRTAWLSIPAGTKLAGNRISVWQPRAIPDEAWGGRVALVGDAGHAMSFHRGQGMNHGIADACELVAALVEVKEGVKGQKEAVLGYEAGMVKRAGEEVRISRVNTEMMHDWAVLKDSPFMQRGGDRNK